jgi:hypothetical protein
MKDDDGYCPAHGEMHGDCYCDELSESALNGLLSAGWLVSCRGGAWKDFFEEKPYAELRAQEMRGCVWKDVTLTELFKKGA